MNAAEFFAEAIPARLLSVAMDGIYSGTAALGRVYTTIGALVACLIALVLIVIGGAQLRSKRTGKAEATIASAEERGTEVNGEVVRTQYLLTLNYVNAQTAGPVTVSDVSYSSATGLAPGGKLTIYYDPSDPQDIAVEAISPKALGGGLIGAGLVVAGIGVGVAVLARKSKAFAAFEGVAGTVDLLKDI